MNLYLIIDIGTSSLRTALLDDSRRVVDSRVRKRSVPACFDAEEEWAHIVEMIDALTKTRPDIRGIAVSSLLGWVGVDTFGHPVTPCYTYMHQEPETYEQYAAAIPAEKIYAICRRRAAPEQLAFKLCRIRTQEPQLYQKLAYFLSLKDFINMQLTGRAAVDHTSASYSLLYDVAGTCWSRECLAWTELDDSRLPALKYPWEILAPVRPALCQKFGIKPDCPVAVGTVDGSCGILGAGGTIPGTFVNVMGTTDTCFLVCDRLPDDPSCSLVMNPHAVPGFYLAGGPMGMYGGSLEWMLKHLMFESKDLQQMNKLAAALPAGSCGVIAFPTLAGERTPFWNSDLCGTFLGLKHEHSGEHLFRAALEANCYAVRRICELLNGCGLSVTDVLASGGGSQSDLWLQLKADILGFPVARSQAKEATLEGAFELARMAAGGAGGNITVPETAATFEVRPEEALKYDRLYTDYLRVHDKLAELYPLH